MEKIIRFALVILLSILASTTLAQSSGNEITCSGYVSSHEESLKFNAIHLTPIDLEFPKSELRSDFAVVWPLQDNDQKVNYYCNNDNRCVVAKL